MKPSLQIGSATVFDTDNRPQVGKFAHVPIRLTLLGKMRALDATGRDITPRSRKTRALLAILALERGAPVSRVRLTSLLWSKRDLEQARGSLRQCVHELQERLQGCPPDLLVAERAYLSLRMDGFVVDVPDPDRNVAGPDQVFATAEDAGLLLEDMAGLDDAFSLWLDAQRRTLADQDIAVAETVLATTSPANPELVAANAGRLLRMAPTHEAACRALISARASLGEHAEAGRVFARYAAGLMRARQGPPSPEMRSLAEATREAAAVEPVPASARLDDASNAIRLGVMPFRPIGLAGEDASEIALCVGLAEEITTALARFRGISLIASSSLSALATSRSHEAQSGWAWLRQELHLHFLLDGTVQRSGARMRVNVRLLDLRTADPQASGFTGDVVWFRRFERPAIDLLALQDEIAAETVAQVDPALMLRAGRPPNRAGMSPASQTATATAHELLLRAIPALHRMEETSFRAAGAMLARAVAIGPDFAAGHAWYAYWQMFLVGQGWTAEPGGAMEHARELADRAVSLDPTDARALSIAGHVRAFNRHSIDEALALHERAIDLNPNLPLAWALAGLGLCYAGQHELAVRRIEQARKLSPFDPHGFFFDAALSMPLLLLGRNAEALEASRRAAAMNPTLSTSYKGYLAALGQLSHGKNRTAFLTDIAAVHHHLARLEPNFTLATARARSPLRREQDRDIYIEGLRKGGLRES